MNTTNYAGEPSHTTGEDPENTERGVAYDVGFAFIVVFFILILIYTSYLCKHKKCSQSPPPRTTTFPTTTDSDSDDSHCMRLSNGLDDDILSTLPQFLYSEAMKTYELSFGMGCSVCLSDYKPADVIRLLPECGHLFHVKCIDTWLKVHSTCPVCRKTALPTSKDQVDLTDSRVC